MEIPISEFQARVVRFQALLRQHNLDAGLVYYDELAIGQRRLPLQLGAAVRVGRDPGAAGR